MRIRHTGPEVRYVPAVERTLTVDEVIDVPEDVGERLIVQPGFVRVEPPSRSRGDRDGIERRDKS